MFTLPDILYTKQKGEFLPYFYVHGSDKSTHKSRLNFTCPCISIILEGEKHIFADNTYSILRKGDLILLKPGNYLGYEIIEDNHTYRSLMIFFDPRKTPVPQQGTTSDSKIETHNADDYLLHFGKSCQMLFQDESLKNDVAIHAIKFQEFLQYTEWKKLNLFSFFPSGEDDRHKDNFQICVERYWNSTMSVEEMAFLCHMSLSSFKRNFEKAYGESPGRWLKQKRLEHAAMQIKFFKRNPSEIYLETGYADYSSFSHSFKRQFGVCPKAYRTSVG